MLGDGSDVLSRDDLQELWALVLSWCPNDEQRARQLFGAYLAGTSRLLPG